MNRKWKGKTGLLATPGWVAVRHPTVRHSACAVRDDRSTRSAEEAPGQLLLPVLYFPFSISCGTSTTRARSRSCCFAWFSIGAVTFTG